MSGLEDLYREIILDHYRSPRNKGELETPPASRTEGFNPLCGDEGVVYLVTTDGVVTDIKINGQGCSISQASASMMTSAVKGKPIDEAKTIISAFKRLMMIHETSVGGDGSEAEFDGEADDACRACCDRVPRQRLERGGEIVMIRLVVGLVEQPQNLSQPLRFKIRPSLDGDGQFGGHGFGSLRDPGLQGGIHGLQTGGSTSDAGIAPPRLRDRTLVETPKATATALGPSEKDGSDLRLQSRRCVSKAP